MYANLIAFVTAVITFIIMFTMTSGEVVFWKFFLVSVLLFAISNIVARFVHLAKVDQKTFLKIGSHRSAAYVASGGAGIAWFHILVFGFNVPSITSVLSTAGISTAVFLTVQLFSVHLARTLKFNELLNRDAAASELLAFLTHQRPGMTMATLASVAFFFGILVPVGYGLFNVDSGGAFLDRVFGSVFVGSLISGGLAFGQFASLWVFLDHRNKDEISRFEQSTSPACRKAIEGYHGWVADERAKRVYFNCPHCSQRVVPPEDLITLTHVDCLGCGHRIEVVAASAQPCLKIWTNPINEQTYSNFPLLITQGELVVCAGPRAKIFDLRKIDYVKLEFRVGLTGNRYVVTFTDGKQRFELSTPKSSFRIAFLNVYCNLHPYHGEPACWFCGKVHGAVEKTVPLPIHRVITRTVNETSYGWEVGTQYEKRTLQIPRCKACAKAHVQTGWYVFASIVAGMIAIGGGGLFFFAFFVYLDAKSTSPDLPAWMHGQTFQNSAFVLSGLCTTVGGWCLLKVYAAERQFFRKRGVRPEGDFDLFPPYRIAWEQGFRLGEKPSGRAIYYGQIEDE